MPIVLNKIPISEKRNSKIRGLGLGLGNFRGIFERSATVKATWALLDQRLMGAYFLCNYKRQELEF